MPGYSHLTADESDRLAELKADGLSLQAIARALGRAASTLSREPRRNALDSGAYRPHAADGAYLLHRRRAAIRETDTRLAAHGTARLWEGWTPEQIAGRLRLGIQPGLRAVCTETISGWNCRAGQKTGRLWRTLTRRHGRRRKRHGRAYRDTIAEKTHLSQRSGDADARETVGHWGETGPWPRWGCVSPPKDLVICRRSRPALALRERKTRITLRARPAGKTAGETVGAMMATFRRLDPRMRGSVTFDNDTSFARHMPTRAARSGPPRTSATPAPAGGRAGSRTPTAASDDGCRAAPALPRSAKTTSRRSP